MLKKNHGINDSKKCQGVRSTFLMKSIVMLLTILLFSVTKSGELQAKPKLKENINKANKIYVVPITGKYYYVGYFGTPPGIEDRESVPSYEFNKDYNVGDIIKVTGTPPVSEILVKVLGVVPEEIINNANRTILETCKQKFGEEKVSLWPEGEFTKTTWAGETRDYKTVDCDFYLIPELITSSSNYPNFQTTTRFSGGGLITFIVKMNNTKFEIRSMKLFPNYFNLKLFHKSKSGKNGKKVIVARKENVFIDQTKEKSFTLDSEPNTAELEKILWPKYDTLGDDILLKYTESFKKSLDETVDDFFKKVDKELAK